jgi:DNA polymerase III epsilon subunit-like protein
MSENLKAIEKMKILFFDTETSNFIKKELPADHPDQAWCVQIGAILSYGTKNLVQMNLIIESMGRSMNYYAQQVHGISTERADEEGVPEVIAAEQFGLMLRQADLIVCHNADFDWKYVEQIMERNLDKVSDEARSAFYLEIPSVCTMKTKAVVNYVGAVNKNGKIKWPKLVELHEKLFDVGFEDAHDAFADITATKNCFIELINKGIIELKL